MQADIQGWSDRDNLLLFLFQTDDVAGGDDDALAKLLHDFLGEINFVFFFTHVRDPPVGISGCVEV